MTAPKRKEAGVLYATACPACTDELALGWLPTYHEVPWVQFKDHRRPWPRTRPDGVATDPVTCHCGQVTLALLEETERARVVVTWTGSVEPILRVLPQYGSPRDLAAGG